MTKRYVVGVTLMAPTDSKVLVGQFVREALEYYSNTLPNDGTVEELKKAIVMSITVQEQGGMQ